MIFDEPTPLELILATRPDVLVKGGDYSLDTVVGAREVESLGGQVKDCSHSGGIFDHAADREGWREIAPLCRGFVS